MTKKPYDWEGVKRLPLGTKFTDGTGTFYFTYENGYRELLMVDKNGIFSFLGVSTELTVRLMMQDTFEVVDCKHDNLEKETKKLIKQGYVCAGFTHCDICGEKVHLEQYNEPRASIQYVTLGEALANVATGKWKRAAYDSEEWRDKYNSLLVSLGDIVSEYCLSIRIACSEKYQDAKWYEVME